jgi:dynein light intermediate chain, axonemal
MRVRDELYMTINSYEMLYESSLTFSMRKQLQAEQGAPELQTAIVDLEEKRVSNEEKVEELKKRKEALEKQIKEKKQAEDKKRLEEIDFLKYQANHLHNFLRSVNEANK